MDDFLPYAFLMVLWSLHKENKQEGQCAQSKGQLLQLQIQALQGTECGYKNSSSKFVMAKPLKWGKLGLCTLIFQYDNHKIALKD